MQRLKRLGLSVGAAIVLVFGGARASLAEGKEVQFFSTVEAGRPYEVIAMVQSIGIVTGANPWISAFKDGMQALDNAGKKQGADAVIGIRILNVDDDGTNRGILLMYGTAVKFK